ncbi:uncharacterized protein F5891DRAFT_1059124 [Suillus fuscotomentosus]|uniref:Uncharacterized protein n=1 Tax=Suillus fuscotomentosus TaxID=1912939 RepID=A0AAD4HGI4_9AGAM|nr:uncharacterized protein F5891DRAFT_1059124 [Suillus fuscotomentosus]KAG1895376.1 hypothetical protein F5891DRAFT_1059124 [Suillus fuscotomentosus]
MTKGPGPQRKRQLRTVKLQDASISTGDANIQSVTKKPVGDGKPTTLAQRLARAAILSHVETKESPADGISSSRRPLNFVSFPKFATPPSPRKKHTARSAFPGSESSAVMLRNNRRQRAKVQPTLEHPGCHPLNLVPSHEAQAAGASGARSHSGTSADVLDSSRHKRPKRQQITNRPGCPPLKFVPAHEAEAANAKVPRPPKRRPIPDRHGRVPLKFVPAHEAEAAYAAMFPRRSLQPRPTSYRPGCPPLKFVPAHEAKAAHTAKSELSSSRADRDARWTGPTDALDTVTGAS